MQHFLIYPLILISALFAGCSQSPEMLLQDEPETAVEAIEQLDYVLTLREDIDEAKRLRLDSLKRCVSEAATPMDRYLANKQLFDEYKIYSMDTTLVLARRCIDDALSMNNDSLLMRAYILEAEGLKGVGDYNYALNALSRVTGRWRDVYRQEIIYRYISIYYSLCDHAYTPEEAELYRKSIENYRDSIRMLTGRSSASYWLNMAETDRGAGRPQVALADIDSLLNSPIGSVNPGIIAFLRAKCNEDLGNMEEAKRQYAMAAVSDILGCVRKYEALQELARVLSAEGDDQRAYKYIMCAISDIHSSNARSRIPRIVGYVPIITNAYTESQQQASYYKTIVIVLVSVLLLSIAVAVILHVKDKNRRLDRQLAILNEKNEELEKLRKLLSNANHSLEEAGKVKERHLGYLFRLCSEYIGSLDSFSMKVARQIKTGNINDFDKIYSTYQSGEHLQSFFRKFDSIILDIYPDFIEKINTLMAEGHELKPCHGELLSPELRIYALVRLGINDSVQIAAFLHYSPQTVYNYRSRVRSHSKLPREQFLEAFRSL